MLIINNFADKKIYHYMLENKDKNILFVLPNIDSLKHFDPILQFLKNKWPETDIKSGLLETIKNRDSQKEYIFINMLNSKLLKQYDIIFRLPEIFDYAYFIPEIVGYSSIPNVKMNEQFNFVLSYYNIKNFVIINIGRNVDAELYAKYIDFMGSNKVSSILIGNTINCAEVVNCTKTNPVVIYRKNLPLITDLIKKCRYVLGFDKPNIKDIAYTFVDIEKELKIWSSK